MKKESVFNQIEIQNICKNLVYGITSENLKKYDTILTLTKGGLFACGYFIQASEIFGFRPSQIISLDQHNLNFENLNRKIFEPNKCLFIDDILDTGKTIQKMEENLKCTNQMLKIFLLDKKLKNKYIPNNYIAGKEVEESWVVFPWDAENS